MGSIGRTLGRGVLRDIGLTCLAVLFIGLSYGAIAVASGFPLWLPAAQSVIVLAGASEFLFIGIVAAGGNPIAAALAGLLVNARHLPYGLALPDITGPDITGPDITGPDITGPDITGPDITGPDITGPDMTGRGWRRLVGTHLMNDESVVFALAQDELPRKRAAYWACGLGVLICWPGGAVLGALIGSAVHDTGAFGLDAMFPAVILALIVPDLRDRMTLRAALVGAAVALAATPFLPSGLPVLLALAAVILLVRQRSPGATAEPAATAEARSTPDAAAAPEAGGTAPVGAAPEADGTSGEHPVEAR